MKKTVFSLLAAAVFAAPAAHAVNTDGTTGPYAAAMAAYEFSDSARHAKDGLGAQLTFGIPLQIESNGALEFSYYGISRDRKLDGHKDYQTSLLVNYVHDFGAFGLLNGLFKPYVTGGLGGVQEDVLGEKSTHLGIDVGFGTLVKLPWYGISVRAQADALGVNKTKDVTPDKDFLVDYRVMLGLQVPLMGAGAAVTEAPKPIEACELAVVDPATGRRDCAQDTDHDGVADGVDQCPGTAPGTAVNEVGCPVVVAPPSPPPVPVGELQPVFFADNVALIDDASKAKLDLVAAYLVSDPAARLEVEGHADNRGTEAYNIVLASQRAEAVRQYLIGKGIESGRLTTLSYGEFKPVASNKTESGRALNRSAQYRIIK
jgi:OmpA-OmpF porin, OOP family